jgi:hypothetical protein
MECKINPMLRAKKRAERDLRAEKDLVKKLLDIISNQEIIIKDLQNKK